MTGSLVRRLLVGYRLPKHIGHIFHIADVCDVSVHIVLVALTPLAVLESAVCL